MSTATDRNAGLRIVLVEDEVMIAMAMQEILQELGHVVCAAVRTEADAVDAADRFRPDLMIVDEHLKVGSGIAAMRTILVDRFVPHIVVSGDSLAPDSIDRRAILMRKPFSDLELAEAVQGAAAACHRFVSSS